MHSNAETFQEDTKMAHFRFRGQVVSPLNYFWYSSQDKCCYVSDKMA